VHPSRREFVRSSAGGAMLLAGLGWARGGQPEKPKPGGSYEPLYTWTARPKTDWVQVAPGIGGNMMVVRGDKQSKGGAGEPGCLLVDTMTAPLGAQVRREAEHIGGGKVSVVVNTHHHENVTGGNIVFTADTRVIAHVNAKARIIGQANRYRSQVKEFLYQIEDIAKKSPKAAERIREDWAALHKRIGTMKGEDFAPTETFDVESETVEVGGRKVVLHHFRKGDGKPLSAHTDNDTVVHIPEADLVHTGGLVSYKMHAEIDRDGGASTAGWIEALGQLEKMCDAKSTVVPGEGAITTGPAAIAWQREYLEAIRSAVGSAIDQGKTRAEVRKMKPHLKVGPDAKEDRLVSSLDAVYQELMEERKQK
jgi:cyclase